MSFTAESRAAIQAADPHASVGSSKDCMKTDVDVISAWNGERHQPGSLLQIHPVKIDGKLIPLSDQPITIGRDETCGLSLADKSVSRSHAHVVHIGTHSYVQDLGSTNGSWLNDVRIGSKPQRLSAGDRIRFGTHVFKHLTAGDIETQYHAAAYVMMTRDGTTGAMNRESFLENYDREINRATRRRRSLSLILFDIDHFKQINDTYGHLAGDQILQSICHEIKLSFQDEELLARIGGEEFGILLPEEDVGSAARLAERCREVIEAKVFDTCSGSVNITVSLGVAELSEVVLAAALAADAIDSASEIRSGLRREMMLLCDKRMYAAKSAGRNRVVSG